MIRRPRRDPMAEARRLRAVADEAKARLDHLEGQRVAAQDACYPGPHPKDIDQARRFLEAAEAQADAAARMAGRAVLA
jgi:hypothetical protein